MPPPPFFPKKKPNNKNYHTHIKSKSVVPNYRIKASSTKLSYILVSLKKNRGCSSNFIQVQWELRPVHANEVRVVHLIDVIMSNQV
jgi:hypothetical protein